MKTSHLTLKNFEILGNLKQPLFAYLNINSLRILGYLSSDYVVLFKTKLDDSFPSAQFNLPNYKIEARRDRDKNGGGSIEFAKKGFICKRLKIFEPRTSECICSEITVSKKKGLCISIYRPPSYDNLELFFDELTRSLRKASESYKNFIVMGDINIDVTNKGIEFVKLDKSCDLFNLTDLVISPTCFTKTHKSTIDLILTNTGNCFQKTKITETDLSDFHKLIQSPCRQVFEIVRVHQQREFFNIQKLAWAWKALKLSRLN